MPVYTCTNCKERLTINDRSRDRHRRIINCCPVCGHLYPAAIDRIRKYFRTVQLSPELDDAVALLLKSEGRSAVREALVTFESIVRQKARIDGLTGSDLMAKAFSFKYESTTQKITDKPIIKIGSLSTETGRNEQEGVKFLAMGLMRGARNIYAHSAGNNQIFFVLEILTTVDLLLKLVSGGSLVPRTTKARKR